MATDQGHHGAVRLRSASSLVVISVGAARLHVHSTHAPNGGHDSAGDEARQLTAPGTLISGLWLSRETTNVKDRVARLIAT